MTEAGGSPNPDGATGTGPIVAQAGKGDSQFEFLGLNRDHLVQVALRAAAPAVVIVALLWVTIEVFAGSRLSTFGVSTTSLSAGITLLGLGSRITVFGSGGVEDFDASASLAISGIWLTFPALVYIGAFLGLKKYVGVLPRRGLAVVAALGAGLVPFALTFLVDNSRSTQINGVDLSGSIDVSVLRAVLVSAAVAALATVRFTYHPILERAQSSWVILKSVATWLLHAALVAWILVAAWLAIRGGSLESGISLTDWLKLALVAALFVPLIVLLAPHWAALMIVLATGASVMTRGFTSVGGVLSELAGDISDISSELSESQSSLPGLTMGVILLIVVAAAVSVARSERAELWYEAAAVFGLVGAVTAIATRSNFSASGDLELLDGSTTVSTGIDILPATLRLAALGALLGLTQHPRVFSYTNQARVWVTTVLERFWNLVKSKLSTLSTPIATRYESLVDKNPVLSKNTYLQRLLVMMFVSFAVVLFAAGAGKVIASVGERFVEDPRESAEEIAAAFRSGDADRVKEIFSIEDDVLPSSGTDAKVVEVDEGESYRYYRIVLSDGTVVADLSAYESDGDSNTQFFGLVKGWTIIRDVNLPAVSNELAGSSGLTLTLNEQEVTAEYVYVMPGEHEIEVVSDAPQFVEGGTETKRIFQSTELSVPITVTDTARNAAIAAVNDFLSACPVSGDYGCPSTIYGETTRILTFPSSYRFEARGDSELAMFSGSNGTLEYEWGFIGSYLDTDTYSVFAVLSYESGELELVSVSS